jgi:two-component system, sensor histidine kinase and response regulator
MSTRRSILVVDDDDGVREVIVEYLRSHGRDVLEATNGLEALLQVKRQRPAAVVLDLNMPRLGGIDTLKRIHAFDPTIRVVVASANVDDDVRRRAKGLGVSQIFDKPVDLAGLLAALDGEVVAAQRLTPSPSPAFTAASDPSLSRRRTLLVADDDPGIREMLEEFFVGAGYVVRLAFDGAGAVREITAQAPDVILLDIEMPGLTGVDALPTIKALAPTAAVIMVSGTSDVEIAKRTLAARAFDYATKPVDLHRLLQSVETAAAISGVGL